MTGACTILLMKRLLPAAQGDMWKQESAGTASFSRRGTGQGMGVFSSGLTAAADGRYGYNAVVTTDGKPTPELLNLAGSLGQVKNEGKYVRMSGGEAAQGGVMTVADMAKKLKGSALGVVLSGKMVSESPVKVNDADIKSMTLMLRPSDGGMEMVCDIEGNNPKENALITLLKMMAS